MVSAADGRRRRGGRTTLIVVVLASLVAILGGAASVIVYALIRSLPRAVLVDLREVILDIQAEDEYGAALRTL